MNQIIKVLEESNCVDICQNIMKSQKVNEPATIKQVKKLSI